MVDFVPLKIRSTGRLVYVNRNKVIAVYSYGEYDSAIDVGTEELIYVKGTPVEVKLKLEGGD